MNNCRRWRSAFDPRALQAELVAGAVEIALESRVEIGDGRSRNVIGVLRGTESPDQWVVVSGHYDRWFQGALDNASGTAAVLEMARAFTGSGIRPARSLLFMAVGSEEAGLEDPERDWLAGSHAFLLANPEVTRKAALVFNLDGVGWTPSAAKLSTTPDILAGQRAVIADLGLAEAVEARALTGSSIDAWNFGVLGGAATNALITWDPSYSPLYHTQEDVFLAGRFANMPRDLSIVGLSLARAATEARPEVRLTALADFVAEQLAVEAKPLAGVSLADVEQALAAFRAAAAAVETAGAGERGDAAARTLMLVRRALVPWLYAANGEFEQSVRIAEYAHRVAALDTAMAALHKEDRQGALEAIGAFYEGRQCQRLSPDVYAVERSFWAGEGGWSSRFGHRAPPPLPAFDAACRALAGGAGPPPPAIAGFEAARAEALLAAEQSLALMAAKLHVATAELQAFIATGASR
ncbi:MAG: M28 family peptidase [Gammaproteobacteria bacterium]|nr:M28 family peptidase [Gammaproteobacteria bacterium]